MSDVLKSVGNTNTFKHPKGLYVLFTAEMWERFSYYGMRAILILFMTTDAAQQGLGLTTENAGAVYGLYTASVYLMTLPGGWLADNVFGQRKAVFYGGVLIMIGHLVLAIPGSPAIFFTGLAFVALGTGLLKGNISTLVGELYENENGAKRDAGFSIFYMGINLGSFFGQLFVPLLAEYNWHLGFGLAAVGMFFGLIAYQVYAPKYLKEIGVEPKAKSIEKTGRSNTSVTFGIIAIILALLITLQLLGHIDVTTATGIAQALGLIIVVITMGYFINILFNGGLNLIEKKKVSVIFILFVGIAIFWSGFEQAASSLNLFARDFTNRFIGGWEMPTGMLQSFNSGFIIIFAPIVGALWVKLAARNINVRTPFKFAIGLILLGLGFWVMVEAAQVAASGAKAGMFALILTYFLHSIGELTISPVGLSATSKLSPKKYLGQMMGIWFVGAALGNLIAGLIGGNFDPENVLEMPNIFLNVVWVSVGAGLIFFAASPFIKKWMGEVT
ncbi:MAG: peptide MFS transporter [Flavobacteriaceae bacterium]